MIGAERGRFALRWARRWAVACALAVLGAASCPAYVLEGTVVGGKRLINHWLPDVMPVGFALSDQPLEMLTNLTVGIDLRATVEAAMRPWAMSPIVGLRLDGTSSRTSVGLDGVNLITFADTRQNRDVVGNNWAVTPYWTIRLDDQVLISETDIVFSPKSKFAADGTATRGDIQGILTHELGHALGLAHSPICSSTMYGGGTAPGDTLERTPEMDDLAGIRAIYYGGTSPDTGAIAGRVLATDGAPVSGAHVVAINAAGAVCVGVLSDRDGSFTLTSLPAGSYQVYAEPLIGHMSPSQLFTDGYGSARRDFRTTFAGGNAVPATVRVAAGETTPLDPISVVGQAPTLSFKQYVWSLDWQIWHQAQSLQLRVGDRVYLAVYGPGMDKVSPYDFRVSGGGIGLDATRVAFGSPPQFDPPYAVLPLSVYFGARPGPRNIYAITADETAVYSGVIQVVDR
jgi:hypothetical protein